MLSLYESVGWSAYTRDVPLLMTALINSSFVATARSSTQELLGLIRTVSDDATICYVQDILVRPAAQREGVGRALLNSVLDRYRDLRQIVLITDDEPEQRAFYESLGFVEGADVSGGPIRTFLSFRAAAV